MLARDYQQRLAELIQTLPNQIRLPEELGTFFDEQGPLPTIDNDRRRSIRTRVRAYGVLMPEKTLPAIPRVPSPQLIFTKDFSKCGVGILGHNQFYPGEQVRVILAKFWLQLQVRRCRRLGEDCYEIGASLLAIRDESLDAFDAELSCLQVDDDAPG